MNLKLLTLLILLVLTSACQKQSLELAGVEPMKDAPKYDQKVKLAP